MADKRDWRWVATKALHWVVKTVIPRAELSEIQTADWMVDWMVASSARNLADKLVPL